MPQVGFEPTIPVFVRAKTVHILDRAATVIGVTPCSLEYLLTFRRNTLNKLRVEEVVHI
jgi:hypothetical protein